MISIDYQDLLNEMNYEFLMKEKDSILDQLAMTSTMDPEFYTLIKKLELIFMIKVSRKI
ncbi:hypothetical protein [Gottfriedia solisilvae]|uniref:Uncharacterized protein n=1 Tax=Gottfriedia solisilvae TaxID=1516104 RepID=A0A8J3AWT7_9BACI|nr:hypothetical protein [Gottfriedia solisilvae]GGI18041.1 hypothetical protein GCM10007380_40950 [Gottfriedia solisilvae]